MPTFREDLKRGLGAPLVDLELEDTQNQNANRMPDDFDWIEERVVEIVRTYFPIEHIIRKPVPSSTSTFGEGFIDVSTEEFLTIRNVYVTIPKTGSNNILLPWSIARIWEQLWVGKSDFLGTDLLIYQNAIDQLNRVTNNRFDWKFHEGKVFVTNVPTSASGVGIAGLKGVNKVDDLKQSTNKIYYHLALRLGIAFGKQKIGIPMRKFKVDGIDMPGQENIDEGKDEEEKTMEKIEENACYPGGMSSGGIFGNF